MAELDDFNTLISDIKRRNMRLAEQVHLLSIAIIDILDKQNILFNCIVTEVNKNVCKDKTGKDGYIRLWERKK